LPLKKTKKQQLAAEDISLEWSTKQAVLIGGQTKEETKTEEQFLFYNKQAEQISELLKPKLFDLPIQYTAKGKKTIAKIKPTDNLIIKGNNLLVLHSLLPLYKQKVKLIYIDPPYNTGNDEFGYNDNFSHNTWLTFMKNRLEIAKQYLQPNGLLFVHIGDEEMHYLKVLLDEVMGRQQFVGTIPRKTRTGKTDVPFRFSQDFDWILVYSNQAQPSDHLFARSIERKYYQTPDFPNDAWRLNPITTQRTIHERPNSNFTMINPKNGQAFLVNPNRSWAVTKHTFQKYYDQHKIIFPGDYDFLKISQPMLRVFKSDEIKTKGENFDKTFFSSDTVNINLEAMLKKTMNKNGTDEMIALFGTKVFAYPKNENLLQTIIESCTQAGDLVMDYHLGSGTTAAVAHKLGRQYIGIEQMDYIKDITLPRMQKVLKGDDEVGISPSLQWAGGGAYVYMQLHEQQGKYINYVKGANKKIDSALLSFNKTLYE
jgi:adenine-specific DNA-methyltransferase